ncbi:MAG TPA: hypothetical protein VES97_03370 [Solirubrobacteraceae bacterium]|nr:hypothetical protein [Solirubrobacteraceae bacterium]
MYHLELRQFPHNHCRFNLTDAELQALLGPWVREKAIEGGERKWSPHQARLTILEGPELPVEQLSMGRGWRAAQRQGIDVTDRLLASAKEAADAADAAARVAEAATIAAQAGATLAAGAQPASTPPAGGPPADPLALGVQLASLLGEDPAGLLAAWRAVVSRASGLAPSESLALAERKIRGPGGNPG